MPRFAEIAATTDVSDRADEAAIEQREPLGVEDNVARESVGAVGTEPAGVRPIDLYTDPVDE